MSALCQFFYDPAGALAPRASLGLGASVRDGE